MKPEETPEPRRLHCNVRRRAAGVLLEHGDARRGFAGGG